MELAGVEPASEKAAAKVPTSVASVKMFAKKLARSQASFSLSDVCLNDQPNGKN